jgi:NADPH2:quinone reductase
MKAIRIHEAGGPDVLRYEEVPLPEPGPGEARVRVDAVGVNFIDIYHRSGSISIEPPFTPGSEASGVVDALGSGAVGLAVGDRVAYAMARGSYAEYAVVPAGVLVPLPPGLEPRMGAAVILQGLTAHYLCTSTFPLSSGHTALVHAASGGTGHLVVQVAHRLGARVIATVSTEEKALLARGDGALDVILYTRDDFEAEVRRLTGGAGVDVVYDSVGKDTFDKSLNCLRPRGTMVLYGQSSGRVPPLDPQVLNAKGSLFLTRPFLGHYIQTREELLWRAGDLFDWLEAGDIKVRVDREFALSEAAAAHRYLEGRRSKGKVLLIP